MYTYIKKSLGYNKIKTEEPLDETMYSIGTTYDDYLADKFILWTDAFSLFVEKNPTASIKEILELHMWSISDLSESELKTYILSLKNTLLTKISEYDESENVNSFYYNDKPYWFDKATRVGLVNSTNMEILLGRETTTLIFGTTSVELPCSDALDLLAKIEVYAKDCNNVTTLHKALVETFETIEQINTFNYMDGYPEKLKFNF